MVLIKLEDEWVQFDTAIDALRDMTPGVGSLDDESLMRVAPLYYRDILQQKAIAAFPMETIVSLDNKERDVLYGCAPISEEWHKLPPLAFAGHPEYKPLSSELGGHNTVWFLDTTDAQTFLECLSRYKIIQLG